MDLGGHASINDKFAPERHDVHADSAAWLLSFVLLLFFDEDTLQMIL